MNRIEELEKIIAKAQAELVALRVGGKGLRWRAEVAGEYWVINNLGEIGSLPDYHDKYDDVRHSIGNYFQTKEEAQHALKRTTATQQLKDRIAELNAQHGWVVDWGNEQQNKFLPVFVHKSKRVSLDCEHLCAWSPVEFYGSLETIETTIKEMPEQIKLWLGVE